MDKVRKLNISVCYTPSSEPYSIYLTFYVLPEDGDRLQFPERCVLKN
jgi:hypothetical protein